MQRADEARDIVAACAGDQEAFARLVAPYRRELLIHCYRMLGSLEDAEDTVQETLLRAWRRLGSFEGRSSFRAWCYKIATHAALDTRGRKRARSLPSYTHASTAPNDPLPPPSRETRWLEPLPDALLPAGIASPDALYDVRESVALAFLASLQHLPGRQRAVLILRDVLAWRADAVAELLDMTTAAVNSALQRARATMRALPDTYRLATLVPTDESQITTLLTQYVQAWEAADVPRLVALLHDDAVLTMPPLPVWYQGGAAIQTFLLKHLFAGDAAARFRLLPMRANACPAFAAYVRGADGIYRPGALQVLSIVGDRIATIHDFLALEDRHLAQFAIPAIL